MINKAHSKQEKLHVFLLCDRVHIPQSEEESSRCDGLSHAQIWPVVR